MSAPVCEKCLGTGWAFMPHSDEARERCNCAAALLVQTKARWWRRAPDVILGGLRPYMRRWYILRKGRLPGVENIYLHQILRSDEDRALHDHPWWNVSIVLRGGYWEWMPIPGRATSDLLQTTRVWRGPGAIVFRRATATHRLELPAGKTAWTLFITGKKSREWGFHCPKGWKHWRDFIGLPAGEPNGSEIGPGCGEP